VEAAKRVVARNRGQGLEIEHELIDPTSLIAFPRKIFSEEQASIALLQKSMLRATRLVDPGEPCDQLSHSMLGPAVNCECPHIVNLQQPGQQPM
jgi:hypothetical protein